MGDEVLPDEKFTERIEEIVRLAGSAERLAALAGVAARTVGKYKSGDSLPGMEALVAMARAVNVRLEWLAEGSGPKWRDGGNQSADGAVGVIQVGHGSGSNQIHQGAVAQGGGSVAKNRLPEYLPDELVELVELLSKYGSPAIVAELKRKLLKIKDITEG